MQEFSTNTVREPLRFDYWREVIASQFVDLEFTRNARGTFYGSLATHRLGIHNLLLVKSTSQRVIRSFDRNGGETEDFYVLNYLIEGHGRTAQNGNFHPVSAGEFFMFDLTSPGELDLVGDFTILTLSLSRELVDRHVARAQCLCAVPVSTARPGPGRVSVEMMQSLARNCRQLNDGDAQTLIEGLVRVTAAAYGSITPSPSNLATQQSILITRIRDYILSHLGDEDLSPCRIAAAHGISERCLNKLFENEESTLSRWIWGQRLEESCRMLCNANFADRTIKEIAFGFGFKDMSHFSCAFKTQFGSNPRQYRAKRLLPC
jgi:AraC-like DNA-binding protein